ncbi:MAG: hypothetical protein IAE78_23545 [Myxococcus sp.]|nr:hypothetical protein [Myxococcus sp.]
MLPSATLQLDDDAAMAVLADALASAGDPRGTLMHLQLAREARPHDHRLAEAEARHLALHGKALLGALQTASSMLTLTWRRGFLEAVTLKSLAGDARWGDPVRVRQRSRLPRLLRALGALPVAQRLGQLTVAMPWSSFCLAHLTEALEAALASAPASLRLLRVEVLVADVDDGDPWRARTQIVRALRGGVRLEVDQALRPWLERAGLVARLP